jgi:DNA polymerase-3 subunit gamma/tau
VVDAAQVRDMLGLADRAVVLDLFEAAMGGNAKEALDILSRLHAAGADPGTIVEDLLDLTHALTRLKLAPGGARTDAEARRGGAMAEKLSMPVLTRTWQLLLKGMGEIQVAPNPHAAAEMIVLRLIYAADLPAPGDLVKQLQSNGSAQPAPSMPMGNGPSGGGRPAMHGGGQAMAVARGEPMDAPMPTNQPMAMAAPDPAPMVLAGPANYRELVKLFAEKKEGILEYHLAASARLVRFEPGVVEINPLPTAPPNLANRVGSLLSEWTGRRWVIGISSAPGQPTIAEVEQADRDAAMDSARANPAVQALMEAFPGATIVDVRDLATQPPPVENLGVEDGGMEESDDQTYPADPGDMFLESGDEL